MKRTNTSAILLLACASVACVPTSPAGFGTQHSLEADRVVEPSVPEGVHFNGIAFDGTTLGPGSLDLVAGNIGGVEIHDLSVSESGFVGTVDNGNGLVTISGVDFIGARLYFESESVNQGGTPVAKRAIIDVDDVYPSYSGSPILVHQVEVYKEDIHKWVQAWCRSARSTHSQFAGSLGCCGPTTAATGPLTPRQGSLST